MHPIIRFAALSWLIVFLIIRIIEDLVSGISGQIPYREVSPSMALAITCLAVTIEAFIRLARNR
jgi:hypothetical protein